MFFYERLGVAMSRSDMTGGRRQYVNHRRRQLIFRRICIISAILISSLTLIGMAGILSHAEDNDAVHYYKYYTAITVMPGDTLTSIASEYDYHYDDMQSHIDEIMNINRLSEDTIYAGTSLIVPYYSTEFVY